MSAELNCTNCGAILAGGARFCRHCGHPSANFESGSVTEGTTRILESPERPAVAEPAYVPPMAGPMAAHTSYMPSKAQETKDLARKGGTLKWLIVGGLGVIVILMITLVALAALWMQRPAATRKIIVTPPAAGPVGGPAPPGPIAPPAPPEIGEGVVTGPMSEYVYPGAKVNMHVDKDDGNGVLGMSTPDPSDKVIDWYKAKLKSKNTLNLPDGVGILQGDAAKAIITPGDEGTNIMLTLGEP